MRVLIGSGSRCFARGVVFAARVAAVGLAAVVLSACGGSKTSPEPGAPPKKVFNYTNIDEPKRLDPAFVYDTYEGIVSGWLYDGLVIFGKGTDIQPGLAEKWEVSPDGKTYTFKLRDAQFNNGRSVTSADVRYSFTRILRPETASERKWVFDMIDGADEVTSGTTKDLRGLVTPDARTVVIKLKQPYPAFLGMMAMPNAVIIPDGAAGTDKPNREFEQRPIGTGPWVLDKWITDQRLEFIPNPNFWGTKPKVDRLVFHVQKDDRVSMQQFDIGNFDMNRISFTIYQQWITNPEKKARLIPQQELNTYFVAFQNQKPALKDKRVRQAIALAVDTKRIFETIQKSRGVLPHGPVPPGVEGYRDTLKPRAQDLERAKALLAEAGAKDLKLQLWFTNDSLTQEVCAAVKADAAKIGVNIELVSRDLASLRQAIVKGVPDMYHYSWWLDYGDIENALMPTFHSRNIPSRGNGSHYANPEFDKLVDAARIEADPKKRIAMFQQAEDMIIEDCPWIFLYHRKSFYVAQPWITGFQPALMYNADRYTDVDIDLTKKPK